jgi:hypothetical protein
MDRYNAANAAHGYRPGTYQKGPGEPPPSRVDGDGMETVAAWGCEVGCPVASLDGQSGGDEGGASRYFKQVGGQKG